MPKHEDGSGNCFRPQQRGQFGSNGADIDEYVGLEVSRVLLKVVLRVVGLKNESMVMIGLGISTGSEMVH